MRFLAILSLGLALAVPASFAQVKHSETNVRKPARVAPLPKTPNPSAETARDLRRIEMEATKTGASSKTLKSKASGAPATYRPEKSKRVPPINASTTGGMGTNKKALTTTNQGKNPYRGRLRQKGTQQ
jgi:hypothetical protein